MQIVIFTHPAESNYQSIDRYTKMIAGEMKKRKHTVHIVTSKNYFSLLPHPQILKKWLVYLDQYLVFPLQFKRKVKLFSSQVLFVFADQALGPWIPLVSIRPHVIHCHDFMAQTSAMGEIAENKVGVTGRLYQNFIRKGYKKGKNFISISKNTQLDLHKFLKTKPNRSEVVYNGLNQDFKPAADQNFIRKKLSAKLKLKLENGFILHVGGNQFYKNRKGVLEIYNSWRKVSNQKIPLLMVGASPNKTLKIMQENSIFGTDIYFIENASDKVLKMCYQAANVLLFPSLKEGFGWPIAEAMASGCPVITTNEAPMTEVALDAGFYIPKKPSRSEDVDTWSKLAALEVEKVLSLSHTERKAVKKKGLINARRFSCNDAIDKMEKIYTSILELESKA